MSIEQPNVSSDGFSPVVSKRNKKNNKTAFEICSPDNKIQVPGEDKKKFTSPPLQNYGSPPSRSNNAKAKLPRNQLKNETSRSSPIHYEMLHAVGTSKDGLVRLHLNCGRFQIAQFNNALIKIQAQAKLQKPSQQIQFIINSITDKTSQFTFNYHKACNISKYYRATAPDGLCWIRSAIQLMNRKETMKRIPYDFDINTLSERETFLTQLTAVLEFIDTNQIPGRHLHENISGLIKTILRQEKENNGFKFQHANWGSMRDILHLFLSNNEHSPFNSSTNASYFAAEFLAYGYDIPHPDNTLQWIALVFNSHILEEYTESHFFDDLLSAVSTPNYAVQKGDHFWALPHFDSKKEISDLFEARHSLATFILNFSPKLIRVEVGNLTDDQPSTKQHKSPIKATEETILKDVAGLKNLLKSGVKSPSKPIITNNIANNCNDKLENSINVSKSLLLPPETDNVKTVCLTISNDFAITWNNIYGDSGDEPNNILLTQKPLLEVINPVLDDVNSVFDAPPPQNITENLISTVITDAIHIKIEPLPEDQPNAGIKDFWGSNIKQLDTPLVELDIGFVNYITMLPGSDKIINKKNSKRVSTVLEQYVSKGNASITDSPDDATLWYTKFLLLPTILFLRTSEKGLSAKKSFEKRLQLLEKNDWSSFTLRYIKDSCRKFNNHGEKRKMRYQFINNSGFSPMEKQVLSLLATGSIAKAFKVFHQSKCAPYNENTKTILQNLHPGRKQENEFDTDLISKFAETQYNNTQKFTFTPEKVKQIIGEYKSNVAHGPSKWRAEHLKILTSSNTDDKSAELLTSLTTFFEIMANGQLPQGVSWFFGNAICMALLKKPDDDSAIRPIAMGDIFRKICGALILDSIKPDVDKFFADIQYGVGCRNGVEKIIHSINISRDKDPQKDIVLFDFKNAFNEIIRKKAFEEMTTHFPQLLGYYKNFYMVPSRVFYNNFTDYDYLMSEEGSQQGDPLGPLIFALGAHPLFKALSEKVGSDGFVKTYIDDCTSVASTDKSIEIINYIREHGPEYGIFLNYDKTKIYLGSHINSDIDLKSTVEKYSDCLGGVDPEVIKKMFVTDGVTVLGSPIGNKGYVHRSLNDLTAKIQEQADIITEFKDAQSQHLFFHYILKNKINHILRTVRPEYTESFFLKYVDIMKDTFCSIMQIKISGMTDNMWEQCNLPIASGGFGINCFDKSPVIAFTASAFACIKDLNRTFPFLAMDWSSGPAINWITQVKEAKGLAFYAVDESAFDMNIEHFMFDVHTLPPSQHKINLQWQTHQKAIFMEKVFHKLPSTKQSILRSTQRSESGAFLTALPKDELTRMNSEQFRVACRSRLCAPHPFIKPHDRCQFCHEYPTIGTTGEHFLTCKFGNQNHEKHNAIRDTIIKLCGSVGIATVKEPTGLFSDTDSQIRPDILVYHPNLDSKECNDNRDILLDISITNPCVKSNIALKSHEVQLASANHTFNIKNKKYKGHAVANDYNFIPMILESSGAWHPSFMSFFNAVVRKDSETRQIPFSVLSTYWTQRISCILQKGQAQQIIERHRENVMARTKVMVGAKKDNSTMDPDFFDYRIH